MLHVVLYGNHLNIILVPYHVRYPVDIGRKGADNAYPRYIINIFHHIFDGGFIAVTLQLLNNAFRGFHAGFNVLDWIITMHMLEFIVQDFQLCIDLL